MQPLFFGNNILHLLPYLKCFFRAGCKSLPAVIVRDSLWGLNRCNSGTDGDSPDGIRIKMPLTLSGLRLYRSTHLLLCTTDPRAFYIISK